MTDDGKEYEYVYDPFGRLRKIRNTSNQALVAEYWYNGLGQLPPGRASSPAGRKGAVTHLQEHLARREPHASERRVCRVLDQPRSTQRYVARPRVGDEHLIRRPHGQVRQHPRRGYRMMGEMLRLDGWRVNRKRVFRLWTQECSKGPGTQRKQRRLGHSENGILPRRAERRSHVWCLDVTQPKQVETSRSGRTPKIKKSLKIRLFRALASQFQKS